MSISVTPTQDEVLTALRSVLLAALPASTPVVLGQANRVPEVSSVNFVVMTPTRRARLRTNSDDLDDCRLIGSIAGAVLTVSEVDYGAVTTGRTLWGSAVAGNSVIGAQLTGAPGGAGTYAVTPSQTASSGLMACGALDVVAGYELTVQLDFHGAGGSGQPADNAQTVSLLLRDSWAVEQFAALSTAVTPLHADEPKQIPFINGEGQYEDRWIVDVHLQVNETVAVPQQYMDSAEVGLIEVDTTYPA